MRHECSAENEDHMSSESIASLSIIQTWMEKLQLCLFKTSEWSPMEINDWEDLVKNMHQHWIAETNDNKFPKLHMLLHAVHFVRRHGYLGRVSEERIESFHAQYNIKFYDHHFNSSHNQDERIRRTLADFALICIQSYALEQEEKVKKSL